MFKWVLLMALLMPNLALAAQAGERIFKRRCAMCHLVNGQGGKIGPDLSNISARLSADQLYSKTAYPKKSNPGSNMPSFATLPKEEMQSLIHYMHTLR